VNKKTLGRSGWAAAAALLLLAAGSRAEASRLAGEVDAKALSERIGQEKGNVVLVNFWATWCVPCREEFPDIIRLQKAYGPSGLRVIGVTTDFQKETPAVESFLARQNPGFPNYRKKTGGDDQVFIDAVDRSWGGELPFTVLYARDGRKAKVLSGKHGYADYEKEVRALLKSTPAR
jgi:thiol-disulfide isomerase/thioredoxin